MDNGRRHGNNHHDHRSLGYDMDHSNLKENKIKNTLINDVNKTSQNSR